MHDAGELHKTLEIQKTQLAGNDLKGKTIGTIGLGASCRHGTSPWDE